MDEKENQSPNQFFFFSSNNSPLSDVSRISLILLFKKRLFLAFLLLMNFLVP